MMLRSCYLLAVTALLLPAVPTRAAEATVTVVSHNPKLSLKLKDVTVRDALAALSRAAGVPVTLAGANDFGPGQEKPPHLKLLDEKVSFDWSNTTFARALRELIRRHQLQLFPGGAGGYQLLPAAGPPPARPARRVGLVEKNRMRLFLRRIDISTGRTLDFEQGQEAMSHGSLSVQLGCELEEGDSGMLAGVTNLSARDDQGNVLVSEQQFSPEGLYHGNQDYGSQRLPDEWSSYAGLPMPHPRARKLAWLEGDLMYFKTYRPLLVQFPLPEGGTPVRKQVADFSLEVVKYEPAPAAPPAADAPALPGPSVGKLKVRLYVPMGSRVAHQYMFSGKVPALAGASGELYGGNIVSTSSSPYEDGTLYDLEYSYANVRERAVGLHFRVVEMSDPEKLFRFRMTDIPLPPEPKFIARRTLPPPPADPGASESTPERAYWQKGGGTLVSRVLVREQPAVGGTLSLGLSLKRGAGWSGTRWLDVEVGRNGVARLEELKPGTYRLQRVYRPEEGTKIEGGVWQAGEVVVTVAAGKEAAPAPLRWTAEPQGKKPAAARPAVPGAGGKPRVRPVR